MEYSKNTVLSNVMDESMDGGKFVVRRDGVEAVPPITKLMPRIRE